MNIAEGADSYGVPPAHAGIVLNDWYFSVVDYRFPRTRGDSPYTTPYIPILLRVPPHTRG